MILKTNRVRIGYWKKLRVRVGYRVPVGHWLQYGVLIKENITFSDFKWSSCKPDNHKLYKRPNEKIFLHFPTLRGGIKKKKTVFFSEKLRKGGRGVSPNPKFPYQKKLRFFWNFFTKEGGSHLFQKDVIIKKLGILGYFCQKGGSYRFYQKKTQNISDFFAKKGGGLANSKISLSEKTRPFRIAERGGGSQNFGVFLKKTSIFFLMPPLTILVIFV